MEGISTEEKELIKKTARAMGLKERGTPTRNAKEGTGEQENPLQVLYRAFRMEKSGGRYPGRARRLPGGITVGQVLDAAGAGE